MKPLNQPGLLYLQLRTPNMLLDLDLLGVSFMYLIGIARSRAAVPP